MNRNVAFVVPTAVLACLFLPSPAEASNRPVPKAHSCVKKTSGQKFQLKLTRNGYVVTDQVRLENCKKF